MMTIKIKFWDEILASMFIIGMVLIGVYGTSMTLQYAFLKSEHVHRLFWIGLALEYASVFLASITKGYSNDKSSS